MQVKVLYLQDRVANQIESRTRSRSRSPEDVTGPLIDDDYEWRALERSVADAQARADIAAAAATQAVRVALSTPQRVTRRVDGFGLSDEARAEVVQEVADLVGASISVDVAAHVRHHFLRHPLVRDLAASASRPLTTSFSRQEAQDYMRLCINEEVERQARTWRIQVLDRGTVLATITPSNSQAEELAALRASVALHRQQIGVLQARLDLLATRQGR
jgi:hypothetical protein